MKVLICDFIDENAVQNIIDAGISVTNRPDIEPDELMKIIADYDCMVVRSRTKVRVPLIDAAINMKAIVRGGVGLDNIDYEYAESKGIQVLNTPGASTGAVAELTLAYIFALARHIPQMTMSMKNNEWAKGSFKNSEIEGKTLGLIGAGRIGKAVAARAKALGMKVMAYDSCAGKENGVPLISFDELLKNADFISLHVPLTDETRNLIDKEALEKMKDGVNIINCGRGGTINEDALYDAIIDGKVAGAALDVYAEEPAKGNKLISLNQVIGSPHVGANTNEAKTRIGDEVSKMVIAVLNGKKINA